MEEIEKFGKKRMVKKRRAKESSRSWKTLWERKRVVKKISSRTNEVLKRSENKQLDEKEKQKKILQESKMFLKQLKERRYKNNKR